MVCIFHIYKHIHIFILCEYIDHGNRNGTMRGGWKRVLEEIQIRGKKEKEKTERVRECMGHEGCGERKEQEGRRKVGEGGRI